MNQQDDKHLDHLAKKIVKEAALESPSINFTHAIMSQIEALEMSSATMYKPLISKTGWVVISMVLLGVILYAVFGSNTEGSGWLSTVDLSVLSNFKLTNLLSGVAIPKTVTYCVVLFGLMLSIQVLFLKRHFNKQFEV